MRRVWLLMPLVALFAVGCATGNAKPIPTQMQIREYQTRMYDTTDTKMVMKAMLNVLQDDGFIVKNAVVELGLLSAEKQVDIESTGEAFLATFFAGSAATWKKARCIDCTANVNEYGDQVRVRVNFQMKVLNNKGGIMKLEQVKDQKYYQNFFSKVDKGIFIEKEEL